MGIVYHPQPGTILRVDLSEGFHPPEMGKRRPAVVISPKLVDRDGLCTIVPLSTTPPRNPRAYNCPLRIDPPLPPPYDQPEMWVKADMLMTVSFRRLQLLHRGKTRDGQRIYDVRVLPAAKFEEIKDCIRHALDI